MYIIHRSTSYHPTVVLYSLITWLFWAASCIGAPGSLTELVAINPTLFYGRCSVRTVLLLPKIITQLKDRGLLLKRVGRSHRPIQVQDPASGAVFLPRDGVVQLVVFSGSGRYKLHVSTGDRQGHAHAYELRVTCRMSSIPDIYTSCRRLSILRSWSLRQRPPLKL